MVSSLVGCTEQQPSTLPTAYHCFSSHRLPQFPYYSISLSCFASIRRCTSHSRPASSSSTADTLCTFPRHSQVPAPTQSVPHTLHRACPLSLVALKNESDYQNACRDGWEMRGGRGERLGESGRSAGVETIIMSAPPAPATKLSLSPSLSPTVHGVPIPLLLLTVDLGSGRQDVLPIYSESEPAAMAKSLAAKHRLKNEVTKKLEILITKKKEESSKFVSSHGNISMVLTTTRPSVTEPTPLRTRSQSELRPFSSKSTRPSNYGEWMYQRGQQFKGKLRYNQMRSFSSQDLRKTVKTGKTDMKKREKKGETTEESLMKKAEVTELKIKNQRSELMEKEMSECTFKPTINGRSEKLDRSSSASFHGSQRFEKLYTDAYDKELRQLDRHECAVKTEFPFHPTVTSTRKAPESQSAMVARLLTSKKNFQEVVTKLKTELDESFNRSCSATGFKPVTGRGPRWSEYTRKGPVHEHLYSQRTKHKTVVDRMRQQENDAKGKPGKLSIRRSEEMVVERRKQQVETMFKILDQNRDGQLDFDSLALDEMDNRSMLILSPIWAKLQETGQAMDFSSFEKEVEALLLYISNEEKTYLLKAVEAVGKPGLQGSGTEARQPGLSKTSEELANRRKQLLGGDIYTRRMLEEVMSAERLQFKREALAKEELKACTFRPALNNYRRKA